MGSSVEGMTSDRHDDNTVWVVEIRDEHGTLTWDQHFSNQRAAEQTAERARAAIWPGETVLCVPIALASEAAPVATVFVAERAGDGRARFLGREVRPGVDPATLPAVTVDPPSGDGRVRVWGTDEDAVRAEVGRAPRPAGERAATFRVPLPRPPHR